MPRSRGIGSRGGRQGGAISVAGTDDLLDFARSLQQQENGQELVKDMLKAFKVSAKKLTPETRRVALQILPQRGGLARLVAKAPQRVVARVGNTTANVAVVVSGRKKGTGASQSDTGRVRHPVFDRVNSDGRRVFVGQDVRAGWFSRTAQFHAPDVQREVIEAMDEAARRAGFR